MKKNAGQSINFQQFLSICGRQVLYYSLLALPFVASFSSALVNTSIGFAIFGLLCIAVSERKIALPSRAVTLSFILIIIWSFVSFHNTISVKSSFGGIVKLLKYGFLILAACNGIKDRRHLRLIITSLVFGLLVASIDAIYQLIMGVDIFLRHPYNFVIGLPRLSGVFPHTNLFGGYLALFIPLAAAIGLYYTRGRKKAVVLLVSALATFCLVYTFSRSAIAGLGIAIFIMAVAKRDKIILFGVIAALILTPFLLPKNIRDWVKTNNTVWEVLLNKERINIYRASLNMIKAHPVMGVGTNTFCINYQKYKAVETDGFTYDSNYYAHNIFLHTAGELGVVGLMLLIWFFIALFTLAWRCYRLARDNLIKVASLGVIGSMSAFIINGLTESNLYYSKIATLFFFMVGLLLGIYKIIQENGYEKAK